LLEVLQNKQVPQNFIVGTVVVGSIIGRYVSIILDLSLSTAFFVIFGFGILTSSFFYFLLTGFFLLAAYYSESWGNLILNYLFQKCSDSTKKSFRFQSSPDLKKLQLAKKLNRQLRNSRKKNSKYF
jgi:hypothetical protein